MSTQHEVAGEIGEGQLMSGNVLTRLRRPGGIEGEVWRLERDQGWR